MIYHIRIVPSEQRVYVPNQTDVFRIMLQATTPADLPIVAPTKIFRYRDAPAPLGESAGAAIFDGVCSPTDLSSIPPDIPDPASDIPWFRSDTVELDFISRSQAEQARASILGEVQALLDALSLADDLVPQPPIDFSSGA